MGLLARAAVDQLEALCGAVRGMFVRIGELKTGFDNSPIGEMAARGEIPMEMIQVPVSALEVSLRNVRQAPPGEEALAELEASIRAHGLLCPLIVEGDAGRALVIGGGRRLAALRRLVDAGELPAAHPVPCVLVSGEHAEISLAENSAREDLHPVDQAEAFVALRDAGATDRDLVARFGTSPRTVQRRLRMARAAPELLARCRKGELSLAALEAVTVEPDPQRQIRAVEVVEAAGCPHDEAGAIRARLTREKVPAHDKAARFVGLEAYEAAGGACTRDLFAEGGAPAYLDDPVLLEQLALEKLDEAAEAERARGWPVTIGLDRPEDWWNRYNLADADTPEHLPGGGRVHLSLGHDGQIDRLDLVPEEREKPRGGGGTAAGTRDQAGLPKALRSDLLRMRLSIERAALADAPASLARDLLLYSLCGQLHGGEGAASLGLGCSARAEPDAGDSMQEKHVPGEVAMADRDLAASEERLLAWREVFEPRARWEALRAMSGEDRERLLACCVARMLLPRSPGATVTDVALAGLGIDWHQAFVPGAAVLSRLTRLQLIHLAEDHLPPGDLDPVHLRKIPKSELVESLDLAFDRHRVRHGRSPWIPAEIAGEDES